MDWLLFGPSKLIAHWPYAGFVVGAFLIAFAAWRRWKAGSSFDIRFFRDPIVFAGVLWALFNAYERQTTAIAAQALGSGAFRMDLIVLIPILYVMSAAAVATLLRGSHERSADETGANEQGNCSETPKREGPRD